MERQENNNLLYKLLIEPRFRILRHIILFCVVCLIILNQFLLIYSEVVNQISPSSVIAGYMLVYLSFIYLNLYVLVPKFLLKTSYFYYLVSLLMTAISITVVDISMEYVIHHYYKIPFNQYSFFSPRSIPLLELLSEIFLTGILLVGISVTAFFKSWISGMQREESLKREKLHIQLDGLKERVTPSFLMNVLYKAGELTETSPDKSSELLLRLSRLLRYQLYDSSRDAVLLRAEITFLSDYLRLENSCNDNLTYEITYPPLEKNYFVSPLSFIPLVEDSLEKLRRQEGNTRIELKFVISGNGLLFTCKDNQKETNYRCSFKNI